MKKTKDIIHEEALQAIKGKHRAGLGISVGVGKTLIALKHMSKMFVENPQSKYLVVIPKIVLIENWKAEAKKHNFDFLIPKMVFSTYRSINKQSLEYKCLYLDECHSLLETHLPYLSMYEGRILGLTGTPPKYKTERSAIIDKYCPITYRYVVDNAVEDNILNDYNIIIHNIMLGTERNVKVKTAKNNFYTTEVQNYAYWTQRIESSTSYNSTKIARIMRMKSMMDYSSKTKYAKELLEMIDDKCIIFCNSIIQAEQISPYSYNSKNKNNDEHLKMFETGKIDKLSCILQLNEGVNIPNLKTAIILHAYGNEKKLMQRLGRTLRLLPDETATIHILMFKGTVDENWVNKALSDLNQEKITYFN